MDCAYLWEGFLSRIEQAGSPRVCKRKHGVRSEAENGKPANGKRITHFARSADGSFSKLRSAACHRYQLVLHVGFSHVPERHFGAPPEVDLRPQLCARHAGAILVLLGLLSV